MKKCNGVIYSFVCDKCYEVAGISQDEHEALRLARITADKLQWEWRHPHWGLICKDCEYIEQLHKFTP
jgi:hypothetical protein